ncbi:hypothetical protein PINS_up021528 [Pythium insidiosum]|nr:hypothetical protein PINS_up021528 [Pythium insidiosum]
MPDDCAASGVKGGAYLLIFLPYIVASLFGLRVFQMAFPLRSRSGRTSSATTATSLLCPQAEVDYWQPMPWDRKVPKTRLLGPCCWRKMRRPFEPFYTWWRHENYFTWIFFPYRNERLSRGERAIIIFCSLYVTFYVTFVLALVRDAMGDEMPLLSSVAFYWAGITLLPTLAKAVFKEIFKLIFRQRRKFFRAQGGRRRHLGLLVPTRVPRAAAGRRVHHARAGPDAVRLALPQLHVSPRVCLLWRCSPPSRGSHSWGSRWTTRGT